MVYYQLVEHGAAPPIIRSWQPHDKKLIGKRRKPDLAMSVNGSQEELNWKTLASVCEVKYHSQMPLEFEARIQVVDKAFFTLSSQLNQRYFVGITMCGSQMRILLLSRGGECNLVSNRYPHTSKGLHVCAYGFHGRKSILARLR